MGFLKILVIAVFIKILHIPVDTGRKLDVHKTFRRRPGRLLNLLCTFNLRPVSTGILVLRQTDKQAMLENYRSRRCQKEKRECMDLWY